MESLVSTLLLFLVSRGGSICGHFDPSLFLLCSPRPTAVDYLPRVDFLSQEIEERWAVPAL